MTQPSYTKALFITGQIIVMCGISSRHNNVSHSRWTDSEREIDRRRVHLRGLVSSTNGWIDTAREQGMTETNQGEKTEKQSKVDVRSFSNTATV